VTTRLVCVGDSFTEGMSDELRPDGHHRGWADRVAQALARHAAVQPAPSADGGVVYANLAVRGKVLDQVVADQVDLAASMRPTVATFHAGPNDVLRGGTDLPALFRRYDVAVGRMTDGLADGGRLLLFTSIGRAGGDGRIGRLLAERFARFNANVRVVAARHDAAVVDLEQADVLADRRLWSLDRLHLNASGHERVAAAVLEQLAVVDPALPGTAPGWWREPLPPRPVTRRADDLAADLEWVRRHLLPWLARRLRGVSSGDGRRAKDEGLRAVVG
jgi:lysophospholipase L1-like esterase